MSSTGTSHSLLRHRSATLDPQISVEEAVTSSDDTRPLISMTKSGRPAPSPYQGHVYLARKRLPDPWWVRAIEIGLIVFAVGFTYYCYYYFNHVHYHVTKAYAHMGFKEAQHQVGQRFLHGEGVPQDHEEAMKWMRKAADQGHPHAAYNLALGKLKGIKADVSPGEVRMLLNHAAQNGVKEAHHVINNACSLGKCDE